MKVLTGKGVSNGIAIGKLHFFKKSVLDIPTYEVDDIDAELDRYHESMELAKAHLNEIYNNACEKVTKKCADSALIKFKDIPAVPLAACLKVFGSYDKLYDNYVELFAYLEKEGYKIADAPRAVYIDGIWNQEDADKWLTIIQVPVEKA